MLRNSFIFLEKIGRKSESKLWTQGIADWNEFIGTNSVKGISELRKEKYNYAIKEAKNHLLSEDAPYFARTIQFQEQWRLWNEFKDDAIFLDIETDGYYGSITVIGVYDGYESKSMVRGFNLDKKTLLKALGDCKMIVTFNGASFDLPVIKRYFQFAPNVPHIDLRFVCQKIGLTGGLKNIERTVGIKRADEVKDITGCAAITLWELWKATGEKEYLSRLVQYNEEDIVNLLPLANHAIPLLWERTFKKP